MPGRIATAAPFGALALLTAAAPAPGAALTALRAPDPGDVTAPVVAVAALVAWALSAWLVLVMAGTLLGRARGRLGAVGRAAARRTAPVAVRRAVEVALGLTVTAGVLAGPAAAAPGVPVGSTSAGSATSTSFDWPGAGTTAPLDWPGAGTAVPAPAPEPCPPAARPPSAPVRAASLPGTADERVVVAPGDSLWRLAERHLAQDSEQTPSAARTAAAWPAWWAANREAVGDDPDLLLPGTVLRPPPAGS